MSSATETYAVSIVRRAREPMEPADFEVNWSDSPLRNKVYTGVRRVPIPLAEDGTDVWQVLERCLRSSYAPFTRRTRITPNTGTEHMQTVEGAIYGRGSASGGGMYPVELYLVVGPGHGLRAGIYHYSSAHHMLDVLLLGDFRDRVRETLRGQAQTEPLPSMYVLAAVNFWKNAFKYNSFCYHVVTSDIGTLFGAWQGVLEQPLKLHLWFDEPGLNTLLGLHHDIESVFAVTALGTRSTDDSPENSGARGHTEQSDRSPGKQSPVGAARVRADSVQRSRRTQIFAWNRAVQQEMLDDRALPPRTVPSLELVSPAGASVALPVADRTWARSEVRAIRERHSSFGSFTSQGGMRLQELANVLHHGSATRLVDLGGADDQGVGSLLRFSVFANHVADVPAGAYQLDQSRTTLEEIPGDPIHPFLQYTYFLTNYNLEQAAAVVAISGRPEAVVSSVGPRGYRLLNAELGAAAQRLYLGAASSGLGCGAVFGFDNVAIQERLGRTGSDEWPLLLVMIGRERTGAAQFTYVLPTAPEERSNV